MTGNERPAPDQTWHKVFDLDFSGFEDMDLGEGGTEAERFLKVYDGQWVIRNGVLKLEKTGNAIVHIRRSISGDVRFELTGFIRPGGVGELSPILASPSEPVRKLKDDGYAFQVGAENMQYSKIARDSIDVAFAAEPRVIAGEEYTVIAEILEGTLRLAINGTDVIVQRDQFPLQGARCGLYGYGDGMCIRSVRIWAAGVPRLRSCHAVPEKLASLGLWQEAANEYQRIVDSFPNEPLGQNAAFKASLCLVELIRAEMAVTGGKPNAALLTRARRLLDPLETSTLGVLGAIGMIRLTELSGEPITVQAAYLVQALVKHSRSSSEGLLDLFLEAQNSAPVVAGNGYLHLASDIYQAMASFPKASDEMKTRAVFDNGSVLMALGAYVEVRNLYQRLIERYSGQRHLCGRAWEGIAHAYFNEDRLDQALEAGRRIITGFSDQPQLLRTARLMCGDFCLVAGRADEARREYEQLISSHPDPESVIIGRVGLARCLHRESKYQEAYEAFKACADEFNSGFEYWCQAGAGMADAAMAQGDADRARSIIAEAWERQRGRDGPQAILLNMDAGILCAQGKYEAAEKAFRRSVTNYPQTRQARDARIWGGLLLLRRGETREASECLRQWAVTHKLPAVQRKETWYTRATWSAALRGDPSSGSWIKDELGADLTPAEALRRTCSQERGAFRAMVDFMASFDPSWKPLAGELHPA